MSIGTSGRVVVDMDPKLKRQLHSLLAMQGTTLKQWLTDQAQAYIASSSQLQLTLNDARTSFDRPRMTEHSK
jgi:hypothetical protein